MYRFFQVTGIEIEYAIVDAELRPRCLVEDAFRVLAGRRVSEIEGRRVGFSNELAAHVFEIKTTQPQKSLRTAEALLVTGLARFSTVLREKFGARLLPTGMHPFMDPEDTALWRGAGRPTYEAYARVFEVYGHGWMNVQSCHVNLPFGTEKETALLHNAVACLLPYLPALAASSPVYGGRLGPWVDNRLAFYRSNQRRIPQITGGVIPEFMTSYRQYRREVLAPIYAALGRVNGGKNLRHEWVNSRGAILRFDRRAIEIRVLDAQECIKMDVAIAVFVRAALKWMVAQLRQGTMTLPPRGMLLRDLNAVIKHGSRAVVEAEHLRRLRTRSSAQRTARSVLEGLLDRAEERTPSPERAYLPLVDWRLRRGSLSERIRLMVRRRAHGGAGRRNVIHGIYEDLAGCLERNQPWGT